MNLKTTYFRCLMNHNILIILAFVGLVSCKNTQTEIDKFDKRNFSIEKSKQVELLYTDSAMLRITINAPEVWQHKTETPLMEMPKGITVFMYNNEGIQTTKMTANYARREQSTRLMMAQGNVKIINKEGDTLRTEKLYLDEGKQIIYTKEYVKIRTPKQIIDGNGLESNLQFTRYRILDIKGMVTVKNNLQ